MSLAIYTSPRCDSRKKRCDEWESHHRSAIRQTSQGWKLADHEAHTTSLILDPSESETIRRRATNMARCRATERGVSRESALGRRQRGGSSRTKDVFYVLNGRNKAQALPTNTEKLWKCQIIGLCDFLKVKGKDHRGNKQELIARVVDLGLEYNLIEFSRYQHPAENGRSAAVAAWFEEEACRKKRAREEQVSEESASAEKRQAKAKRGERSGTRIRSTS